MKKLFVLVSTILTFNVAGQTPIGFTGTYADNFDSLGATGTNYPAGWTGVRYGGSGTLGATLDPAVSTGSSAGGGIYNVGAAADADRALGVVASGSTIPRFGLQLVNNSGLTIDQISLSADSEQWRTGNNSSVNETVTFEYSLNAADINDPGATFTAIPTLDLFEIQTGSTSGGAIDGNDPANRAGIAALISGANWADGATLTIRWSDLDATGNDGMYAMDNLSISAVAVPEPSAMGVISIGALALLWRRFRPYGEST